jgi:hypothetical protein
MSQIILVTCSGISQINYLVRTHLKVEQYPLRPYEVKQALEQVENNLRLAFEPDPGNYTAYDVYFYCLTNEVTQTEFASLAGAQLKDEDDDDDEAPGGDTRVRHAGAQAPAPPITRMKHQRN